MSTTLCPNCHHPNAGREARCTACGTPLAGAGQPFTITLRELFAEHPAPARAEAAATLAAPGRPEAEEVLPGDATPAPLDGDAWLAADRAGKRAAVRRARLRSDRASLGAAAVKPAVLVYEPDLVVSEVLCSQLRILGFTVIQATTASEAAAHAASRPFAAVFANVSFDGISDGGLGIALCRTVKTVGQRHGADTVFVLVSQGLSPVDRVRADLAGCDEALTQPVRRADIARVFDTRGIPLPYDPRRSRS